MKSLLQYRIFLGYLILGYIDTERDVFNRYGDTPSSKSHAHKRCWTGEIVELVELIYTLYKMKRIDNGETAMNEPGVFFSEIIGIKLDARNLYNAYSTLQGHKDETAPISPTRYTNV